MTSCVACTEGKTALGNNCPNGCNQPGIYSDPHAPLCVECPTCKGNGEIRIPEGRGISEKLR